jgi:hypothetical protein
MIPSMPKFSTPARSLNISPRVAHSSGAATRSVAAKKPALRI